MQIGESARNLILIALVVFIWPSMMSSAEQDTAAAANVLTIGPGSEIRFSSPWRPSGVKYSNAQELVVKQEAVTGAEQPAGSLVARILITAEPRSSYADALKRLAEIAASRDEPAKFVEIGGWPAVEMKFIEPLPTRGAEGQEGTERSPKKILVQRAITAIAADDQVVRFDVSVLPNAPQALMEGAQDLTRSARFAKQGSPAEIQNTLHALQENENKRQSSVERKRSALPEKAPTAPAAAVPGGAPVTVQSGRGELEIATSLDANNVVIAANSGLSFSSDRGAHFTRGSTVFGLDDPTLARAQSGYFYLGESHFQMVRLPSST
jgi:hypothetical protein